MAGGIDSARRRPLLTRCSRGFLSVLAAGAGVALAAVLALAFSALVTQSDDHNAWYVIGAIYFTPFLSLVTVPLCIMLILRAHGRSIAPSDIHVAPTQRGE